MYVGRYICLLVLCSSLLLCNGQASSSTISGSPSASDTPSISVTSSVSHTATPSITPSISDSATISLTPTASASDSVTPTASASNSSTPTVSFSPSPSLSASGSVSPSSSRIFPSESNTVTSTPPPSPSQFLSPSPTKSVQFPSYLPIFDQPAGTQTGEVIIQLRPPRLVNKVADGAARDLQAVIATLMGIPLEAVLVIRISDFQEATVIVCTGNIDDFFNDLNEQDEIFDGTILDNAYAEFIFWGVPCVDPLDPKGLPSVSNPSTVEGTTYEYDFSTFRFPANRGGSPSSPESPSSFASSRYLSSNNIILGDDDEFIIVNINESSVLTTAYALLLVLFVAQFFAL